MIRDQNRRCMKSQQDNTVSTENKAPKNVLTWCHFLSCRSSESLKTHHHPPSSLSSHTSSKSLLDRSMRRAFVAPLLLRTTSHQAHHLGGTQALRHAHASRPRHFSMCETALETFRATPFPQSAELAAGFLKALPATLGAGHEQRVQALLSSSAGTRGLFVALLSTEEITLAERPVHEGLGEIVRRAAGGEGADGGFSGEEIVVLAVKNVTMASAMEVTYNGRGEVELARGSEMTRRRAVNVLRLVDAVDVARDMVKGLRASEGRFGGFGRKWGYGEAEIEAAIDGLREACGDGVLET